MKHLPLDSNKLAAWLDTMLPGPAAPVTATQIQGGASNIIYRVERAGKTYALRRPPEVRSDPTSNNMRRELTLLKALAQTDIVHPRLVAAGEDEAIIGVPFALMDWVDGFTPKLPLPAGFDTPEASRALAEQLINVMFCPRFRLDLRRSWIGSPQRPAIRRSILAGYSSAGRMRERPIFTQVISTGPPFRPVPRWPRAMRKRPTSMSPTCPSTWPSRFSNSR